LEIFADENIGWFYAIVKKGILTVDDVFALYVLKDAH